MSVAPENRAPVSVDEDVEFLAEQITALKELGRQESVSEGEIYDFSIRWGAALAGRLPRLAHYNALGLLTDADVRRFLSLCDELRGLSDLAERLGLVRPLLPDERAATVGGYHRLRMRSRVGKRRRRR